MKKILVAVVVALFSINAMAQHEIGAIVGGMNGASYKYWFNDALALQADLAVGLTEAYWSQTTNGVTTSRSDGMWDFVLNPNALYHWDLPVSNLKIYAGGGLSIGLYDMLKKPQGESTKVAGKFGINAAAGLAYDFDAVPLVLAFDFRPGYGLGFGKEQGGNDMFTTHMFDWKIAVALRYKL